MFQLFGWRQPMTRYKAETPEAQELFGDIVFTGRRHHLTLRNKEVTSQRMKFKVSLRPPENNHLRWAPEWEACCPSWVLVEKRERCQVATCGTRLWWEEAGEQRWVPESARRAALAPNCD